MDSITHGQVTWLLGSLGTLVAIGVSIWWHVESKQDKKIDDLHDENHKSHERLHDKVDGLQKEVHQNHTHLLSKFEELWRNIKNGHK